MEAMLRIAKVADGDGLTLFSPSQRRLKLCSSVIKLTGSCFLYPQIEILVGSKMTVNYRALENLMNPFRAQRALAS